MVCALLSSGLAELPLPTCLWDSLGLKSQLNVKHRKSFNYLSTDLLFQISWSYFPASHRGDRLCLSWSQKLKLQQ